MTTKKTKTYAEIWDQLSAISVNEHTQQKQGLTYLSWAWAWGVMMELYPDLQVEWHQGNRVRNPVDPNAPVAAQYVHPDAHFYPDGSAMVTCTVTLEPGGVSRSMWLPVMDYKMKAVSNPSARDISDAKMRCMVKCFAMFGLGHYIYAGEDLPYDKEAHDETAKLIAQMNALGRSLAENEPVPAELAQACVAARKSRKNDDLHNAIKRLKALEKKREKESQTNEEK